MRSSGYACRHCGREVTEGEPCFPFCSERCRLVDLGVWLDERYRVSRDLSGDDRADALVSGEAAEDISSPEDLDD